MYFKTDNTMMADRMTLIPCGVAGMRPTAQIETVYDTGLARQQDTCALPLGIWPRFTNSVWILVRAEESGDKYRTYLYLSKPCSRARIRFNSMLVPGLLKGQMETISFR